VKVLAYPADNFGCGFHRVVWPCEVLISQGHDVYVVTTDKRAVQINYDKDKVTNVEVPEGTDVVVFQRTTDRRLLDAITWLRNHDVAVVIDVDDDLSAVHPANPAFVFLDPNRAKHEVQAELLAGRLPRDQADRAYALLSGKYTHSWLNLIEACKRATLVTVSTPGLLRRYAAHGRGVVIPNYVPEHYLDIEHVDNDVIGWPAALHAHPNDPSVVGGAITRLVGDGAKFMTIGDSEGVAQAFGLREEPPTAGAVSLDEWPYELAKIGIGIAPLADTLFNSRKSRLKLIEMSAVGVPWVASPRSDYKAFHQMGAGLMADKPKDWYRQLRKLLSDPYLREELSTSGREAARSLRLVDHAWKYADAWQYALDIQRSSQHVPTNSTS
jgi:hypothetical protein